MKSQSTQIVIIIGSSIGITLPAREARLHGIKPGDKVHLEIADEDGSVLLRVVRLSWLRRLFR